MRRSFLLAAVAASLATSGCVQTRQFADLQFTPPQGDYKLLVLRPDVQVSSVTTGGLPEARADWTEQARANVIAALRAQQADRGGKTLVLERRDALPGLSAEQVAEMERLNAAVSQSIALHKYSGYTLPTKRRRGLEYTLGQEAIEFGRRTGYDYALFMHAEDSFASGGRVALQVLGIAGCFVGFCAPNIGGAGQFAYASLVDLRTGEVVWFNVLQTGSQIAGIKMGDIRSPDGAAQMVERLLGRMKPGRDVRRAQRARS
jgi:GNAT superfamily N-acetyltransferase